MQQSTLVRYLFAQCSDPLPRAGRTTGMLNGPSYLNLSLKFVDCKHQTSNLYTTGLITEHPRSFYKTHHTNTFTTHTLPSRINPPQPSSTAILLRFTELNFQPVKDTRCLFKTISKQFRHLDLRAPRRSKTINTPALNSKHGLNLSLKLTSFFLRQKNLKTRQKRVKFKYRFKKTYFSFLAPNQAKKSIMLQKKRIIISRLALNIKRFSKPKSRFTYLYFNNAYKSFTKLKNKLAALENSTHVTAADLFHEFSYQSKTGYTLPLTYRTRDDIIDSAGFHNKGTNQTFRYGEVRVPRVKFKPGYQRIWRRVRTALKDSLRLRFIYQKQLTKYLTHFYNSSQRYALSQAETTFDKTVVYSRILPDMNTFKIFLNAQLIYLNGALAFDGKAYTIPGDVIQITVSV